MSATLGQAYIDLLSTSGSTLAPMLAIALAALLLDLLDISLPRGDSAGGAGALCSAALIVAGPVYAGFVGMGSAVLAHLLKRGRGAGRRLVIATISRASALVGASVVLWRGVSAPDNLVFVIVPAVFLVIEVVVTQVVSALWSGRSALRMIVGSLRAQSALLVAQWSAAVLLLLTYQGMRGWALVPVIALLLLIRQSYALFLSIRETYRTTVEVLVEAAESQDARRAGHSERTAVIARSIAADCGLPSTEVERVGYAALLHDLGRLSEQEDESAAGKGSASAAGIVRGVEFFSTIEPLLRVSDGAEVEHTSDNEMLEGLIVALASDIDAAFHPEVMESHGSNAVDRLAGMPSGVKARAVGAALRLGYPIPAVP